MSEVITLKESSRLIELEKVVTTGLQSWIEVGEALIEIRDSRLYRVEAKTFGEYIQGRFKMSHRHANRLMTGAPIARENGPMGPFSERAVREIAKVEPSKRQEVFEKATATASGHVPTAREIKQVVEVGVEEVKDTNPVKSPEPSIQLNAALDKILQHDLSREDALREAIAYATKRLEKNK
jgi:hypothetical protein